MFPLYQATPTSADPDTRRILEAAEQARQAKILADHRAAQDAERRAVWGDSSPAATADRGVRRFHDRLAADRAVAAHQAQLAAERREVFGDGPPGDSAAFRADGAAPMTGRERARLLAMTPAGRDILRREGQGRATPEVDPAARAELDKVLALSDVGRAILRQRRAAALRPKGA